MKKNVGMKYFLVLIFFVFNSFSEATSLDPVSDFEVDLSTIPMSSGNEVDYFPKELSAEVEQKLDSLFTRFNKRYDFHGSVLVAKEGKILFKSHYGYANFKEKSEIDDSSVFQLASVSKQFTAAAIMILKEEGALSLDDLVTDHFPEFPYEGVSIRHLMNHTGGLPKYFWLAEHKWEEEAAPDNDQMMALMAKEKVERFFSPGATFDYSNSGYFVLASIVEKVSGDSFDKFLTERIFEPLDMTDTYVYRFERDEISEDQLTGFRLYRRRWHAPIGGTVNDAIVGDKNVYSTTTDLLKWVNGLNAGKVISEAGVQEMYSHGKTKYKREVPYGYGFRLKNTEQGKVVYHHGRWNGFSTALVQYPEEELVVITLEHSSFNSMNHLNKKVKSIVNTYLPNSDS